MCKSNLPRGEKINIPDFSQIKSNRYITLIYRRNSYISFSCGYISFLNDTMLTVICCDALRQQIHTWSLASVLFLSNHTVPVCAFRNKKTKTLPQSHMTFFLPLKLISDNTCFFKQWKWMGIFLLWCLFHFIWRCLATTFALLLIIPLKGPNADISMTWPPQSGRSSWRYSLFDCWPSSVQ